MTKHPNDPENETPMTKDLTDDLNNDYLWDGSGMPDPEVQRLESLLVEFRHAERPLALPAEASVVTSEPRGLLVKMPWLPRFAAAAVILLALGVGIFVSIRPANQPLSGPSWDVANLEGAPQIGSQSISADQSAAKLYVGQTLTTNSSSRATLSENDLGQIQIDPNSRVRLLQSGPNHKRLQLDVGTIHAAIWAPPGQFVVDTPSAVAVDLGCAYTLKVEPDGSGTIRTTIGWVGFHLNGRDSFIPAGAMCSTRPKVGPGVPYFEDASESFREALRVFDTSDPSASAHADALHILLSQARPSDGLTLWHLLSRTENNERAEVYARFAALVPPPPGVTREGILALDPKMLDRYWNALDLGDISLWRYWEQSSDPHAAPTSQQLQMKKQSLLKKVPTS
jgi:FecR protein